MKHDQKVSQTRSEIETTEFSQFKEQAENPCHDHAHDVSSQQNFDQDVNSIEKKASKGFENFPSEWYSFFRVFNENTNRYSTSFKCRFYGCNKTFTKKQNILEHFRMH